MQVVSNEGLKSILDIIAAAVGELWVTEKIHLYQNNLAVTPANVLADLVEADFSGYAASAGVAPTTTYLDQSGRWGFDLPSKLFTATTATPFVANVVYGYYVTDDAGTTLLYSERFPAPISINAPGQGIVVRPRVQAADLPN